MAGSNQWNRPHRGSMQIWPRKRAGRQLARVRKWAVGAEPKILGFIGYKAGMTHTLVKEQNQFSHMKGRAIFTPVTIIECPPLRLYSIRFFKKRYDGMKVIGEYFSPKVEKELNRLTAIGKTQKIPEAFDDVKIVVYSQPKLTSSRKKTPDLMELGMGGKDANAKLEFAKSLMNKEIKVSEVFKDGQRIDIHGVTKGKGFQGTVKRYGVKRRQHKSEKTVRGVGTLGSWRPKRVQFTVAQPGKMGYHMRTEFNKICLKVGDKAEEINQNGGIMHYGKVKTDYVLVRGSVPGSSKRQIILTSAIRNIQKFKETKPEITYISKSSKQGC